eukprot:2817930-Rhodomonas_salina.3
MPIMAASSGGKRTHSSKLERLSGEGSCVCRRKALRTTKSSAPMSANTLSRHRTHVSMDKAEGAAAVSTCGIDADISSSMRTNRAACAVFARFDVTGDMFHVSSRFGPHVRHWC